MTDRPLATAPSYAGAWSSLKTPLAPWLLDALSALSLPTMTPVQASAIPALLSHRDVIVEAVTGSGKTLAYLLPLLHALHRSPPSKGKLAGLVICPTRELAAQVHSVLQGLLEARDVAAVKEDSDKEESDEEDEEMEDAEKPPRPKHGGALLVVGGAKARPEEDYRAFKDESASIVVGTPGRVEELLKRKGVDARELEMLILDEADRLLDLGFLPQLQTILELLPRQRRTGLFSATMSDALASLASVGLRNPVRILVSVAAKPGTASAAAGQRRTPASLQNMYCVARPENRVAQLVRILRREAFSPDAGVRKAIVYFATCAQVNYFYKALAALPHMRGLKLYSLHGKQTPSRRRAAFDSFVSTVPLGAAGIASGSGKGNAATKPGEEVAAILLCTDVAARGLDLPDVDLVVQHDAPTDPKVFSHRAGRTARAGRSGRAIVLLQKGREEEYVDFMAVRKVPLAAYPYLLSTSAQAMPSSGTEPEGPDAEAEKLAESLRAISRRDRDTYELGVRAFVSFVRAYSKHEAAYIFRSKDLDLGATARAFGLLRMPRMPEVDDARKRLARGKGKERAKDRTPEEERELWGFEQEIVDLRTFAYLDPTREAQRLSSLAIADEKAAAEAAARAEAGEAADAGKEGRRKRMRGAMTAEDAWSEQKAKKVTKEERREKKARKRAFLKTQAEKAKEEAEAKSGAATKRDVQLSDAEDSDGADDWAAEESAEKRAAKRARKEKMRRNDAGEEELAAVVEPDFFDGL